MDYRYVIVGGGLAGASAIEGIRAHDAEGSILLHSRENHPPYHRPPLSKDLWFGKSTVDKLPVYDEAFYREQRAEVMLRREVVEISPETRKLWDDRGVEYGYEKLLLATGGRPRLLDAAGATLEGVHYFRSLEDYLFLESHVKRIEHALVIGGGFIGLELAAALAHSGKQVSLVFPEEYPLRRILPRDLGLSVADFYRERGVEVISNESIASLTEQGASIVARAHSGNYVDTQLVLVGVGIEPQSDLADVAGLEVDMGICVDEYARTSNEHIWAAGDVAEFPYLALGERRRIEHWDHAKAHGRAAGENMAGANKPYDHIPMFFSDFFDMGWEAVGDIDSSHHVEAVWTEPHREGVLFYLSEDVIRGVLLWNRWGLVDWGRDLIRAAKPMTVEERARAIPAKDAG